VGLIGKLNNMIPVVLIHKGYQDYLGCTLQQANKNNDVYLLGDTKPSVDSPTIKFENISDYFGECDEFRSHYQHLNTTPVGYEIFCYQRWFILKNFMEKHNIGKVFYCDSDVMLFANVTEEWDKFNQYEMTLLHRTAAIASFITLDGIRSLCNLIMTTYKNKDSYNYKKIASHYNVRRECGLAGGVCDMTLLEFFHYCSDCGGGPGKVGEMMQIIDGSTYDHNINVPDQGFDFNGRHKDFKIRDGVPYVFNNRLNKDIKFNSLHFQGGAKSLIRGVYEQCK
jgi:hypothetical protein